ncbi:MAG: hypothetical protein AB7J13_05225 [Pyrinomonadaceae bacterium]
MYLSRGLKPSGYLIGALVLFLFGAVCSPLEAQKVRLRSQITPECTVASGSANLKFADIYAAGNVAVQGSYN